MWAAAGMLFLIHLSPGFSTPLFDYLKHDLRMPVPFIGVLTSVYGVAGIIASLGYAAVCRRLNLGNLLAIAVVCAAAGALVFLAPLSRVNALAAFAAWGFGSTAAQLAGLDLAARASPRGIEAMAYSLMASAWNISLNLSDVTGSALWDRLHHRFGPLVLINAGTTLLVLVAIPFLPRVLTAGREGDARAAEPLREPRGFPVEA
jgi:predicted MFS family arabinose efflux permease